MLDSEHEPLINGYADPNFDEVRTEFAKNFQTRGEIGAACAIYCKKKKVVDLWGGYRDTKKTLPWKEDTLVTVASTTKGLAGIAVAVAHSRGLIDFDEKVAVYWPEFAQNGKKDVTVRQLLSHQAGLCCLDKPLTRADVGDLDKLAEIIAAQKSLWPPGTRHGYHAVTLGWYESELIRRVDPKHRSMGKFFQDEVSKPLDLEFYIGLPSEVSDSRIAEIRTFGLYEIVLGLYKMPFSTAMSFLNPLSMASKAFGFPKPEGSNEQQRRRDFLSFEGPGINGIGQVRSIAKAYGALAAGGEEFGLRKETIEALAAPSNPVSGVLRDEVLKINTSFSVGFVKPFSSFVFGGEKAFGMSGTGGSIGFADPDDQVSFAYAPNSWRFRLFDDPRQKALLEALRLCLKRIS